MFDSVMKAVFGSSNDRYVKSLGKIVNQINALEPQMQALTDSELDPMWSYDAAVSMNATSTMYMINVVVTQNAETSNPATFSLTSWLAIPPEPEEETETETEEGI